MLFWGLLCRGVILGAAESCVCTCKSPCTASSSSIGNNVTVCLFFCKANCGDELGASLTCTSDCLGGGSLVYSCMAQEVVAVRDVSVGDRIRAVSSTGDIVCSDVYYVFRHPTPSAAVEVELEGGQVLRVSPNHLVYVGKAMGAHRPTRAQLLKPGDSLVTANGGSKRVVSVQATMVDLVNVLTLDPAIVIVGTGADDHTTGSGVVISAHSFHESAYGYLFWPVRLLYQAFGSSAVAGLAPTFVALDDYVAQPLLRSLGGLGYY